MSDTAELLGIGPQFEYKGQTYQFSMLSVEDYCMFEAALEGNAVKAVKRNARFLDAEEYAEQLDRVFRNAAANVFAFGGELYRDGTRSLPGKKFFALRSLKKRHKDADETLVDEMFRDDLKGVLDALGKVR